MSMFTKRKSPAGVVCRGLLALCLVVPAQMGEAAEDFTASVTFLKGMARLQQRGSAKYSNLTLGDTVIEGDTVFALEDTKLELKLETGAIIRLGSSTTFTLKTLQRTPLGGVKGFFNLMVGRFWFTMARLTGDSDVRTTTTSVVAAVKGTVWRVDVSPEGRTDIVVYDGVVTAERGGGAAVQIARMEKLIAMPNEAFEKGAFDEAMDDKDDWVRWNKSRDKLRIMIILPEKRGGERAMASVAENAAIKRFLNNYMFKVIEQEQVDLIRESEKLKAALKGNNVAAAAAGLEVAADLIVVGESSARYFKSPALGGLVSATANIVARVVRADTAEVIAAAAGLNARAVDITDEAAAHKALMTAGQKMASEFVDSILAKWRREIRKGADLDVVLDGVNYKKLKIVTNKLATLTGVKDVQSLYLVGRRSLLNVTFSGDTASLADAIENARFKGLEVSVVGLSAYRLELEVNSGGASSQPEG